MAFKLADNEARANIKVFGVGGGGGNAVNTMIESKLRCVDFIVGNTDMQALEQSKADVCLQLGPDSAKGLGAGADPAKGREAAAESAGEIKKLLTGSDMVFVTAGLGGGTGTGAAPVVAKIAKELGALTVAVVTKPFAFEGRDRMKNAEAGWQELKEYVDTIITIPNDRLLSVAQKGIRFIDSMKLADNVLVQAVKGITDLINLPGYMNPDFADVKAIMNEMGPALMGAGQGIGDNRVMEAVNMAIASPLLQDISIDGARGVLVNISAREDSLTMLEVTEATTKVYEEVHVDAKIILGVTFDQSLGEELQVTVIATGINESTAVDAMPDRTPFFVPKKESIVQRLPFGRLSGDSGHGTSSHGRQSNTFLQNLSTEDELDRPTFIRKNES